MSSSPFLLKRQVFHYHSNEGNQFNLMEISDSFSYEEYVNNLKNKEWVNYQIKRLNYLLEKSQDFRNGDFKILRDLINELLLLSRYITESRSYHNTTSFNVNLFFSVLPILIRLIFTDKANKTH